VKVAKGNDSTIWSLELLEIDVLNPAFTPRTGTPEAGGLTVCQAKTLRETWHDLN
jgi:arginase family enzyme